jgi:hypothetical protein
MLFPLAGWRRRKKALRIMNKVILSEKDKIALFFFGAFHRLKVKEIAERRST